MPGAHDGAGHGTPSFVKALFRGPAAVGHDICSRDEAGRVGAELAGQRADLLDLSPAAHGLAGQELRSPRVPRPSARSRVRLPGAGSRDPAADLPEPHRPQLLPLDTTIFEFKDCRARTERGTRQRYDAPQPILRQLARACCPAEAANEVPLGLQISAESDYPAGTRRTKASRPRDAEFPICVSSGTPKNFSRARLPTHMPFSMLRLSRPCAGGYSAAIPLRVSRSPSLPEQRCTCFRLRKPSDSSSTHFPAPAAFFRPCPHHRPQAKRIPGTALAGCLLGG
jgi:hypothetical protein